MKKLAAIVALGTALVATSAMADHYQWRRGEHLHDHYRGHVTVINNYHDYRLREPPHGYHWVRDDDGNFVLAAIATGLVADIALNGR